MSHRYSQKGGRTTRLLLPFGIIAIFLATLLWGLAASPAQAQSRAVITVSTTADVIADDGQCSLREAITAANTDSFSGATAGECPAGNGADIIELPAGTYTILLVGSGENNNATGDLDVTETLTIQAQPGERVTIDGNRIDRVLHVVNGSNANLTLTGLTVQGGETGEHGGGIKFDGSLLTIVDSTIHDNETTGGNGGGIHAQPGRRLTLINSTISGNTATTRSGGFEFDGPSARIRIIQSTVVENIAGRGAFEAIAARFVISNSIIAGNSGTDCRLRNPEAQSTVFHSLVAGNCGTVLGGVIDVGKNGVANLQPLAFNGGPTPTHAPMWGSLVVDSADPASCQPTDQRGNTRPEFSICDMGAVEAQCTDFASPYPVGSEKWLNIAIQCFNETTVAGTPVINFTDDIALSAATTAINNATSGISLQINGNDNVLDGQDSVRPLLINADTTVMINALTVQNGTAGRGGGIRNAGTLTLNSVSLLDNTSTASGGGLYNTGVLTAQFGVVNGNESPDGGGIYNDAGSVTLSDTTLSNNTATDDGGGYYGTSATLTMKRSTVSGNIANDDGGGIRQGGTSSITNSTISGNQSSDNGGGIRSTGGTMTINNTTISGNSGTGGRGIHVTASTVNLSNTLLADNGARNCFGTIGTDGSNLSSDTFCFGADSGDLRDVSAELAPLADNGGATQTHALLSNSPAIDAGNNATCEATDQRGTARSDHNCDIGAFELQFSDSPTVTRNDIPANAERTFGPTLAKVTWRTTDPSALTITKIVTETEDDEAFDLIWTVDAGNNSGLDLDITFCYLEAEIPPAIAGREAAFMIYKQPSGGGAFTPLPTTVDEANNCVTATVDGFSNFGIGLAAPTAVELDYFTATANEDGSVTVDWATASEVDHAGFNIYRRAVNSRDDWTAINTQLIASRGTQAQGAEYQFVEQGVSDGRWEYLLEDVENDGDVYRHLDVIETVVIGNPTAVTLTTRTAVGGSAVGFVAQFIGLLLITVGAVARSGRGDEEAETTPKPRYIAPTVTSYSTQALQQQLGPARAYSTGRSLDDELLFGEDF